MAKKKKKNKTGVVVGVIVMALVLVVMIASVIIDKIGYKNDPGLTGNTAGNLNNGGYFCERNGKVFFQNTYDNGSVYVMDSDETKLKRISGIKGNLINADDHSVFFASNNISSASGLGGFAVPSVGIFKMEYNGGKSSIIEKEGVRAMKLIGNTLYYIKQESAQANLFSMDINKREEMPVLQATASPHLTDNGSIYYANMSGDLALYRYDLAGGNNSMMAELRCYNPDKYGQYIYYMDVSDDYHICRLDMSSGNTETICEDRADMYLIVGDRIFYQKSSETEPALMVMNTDGSDKSVVAEGVFTGLSATSRYVYFYTFGENQMIFHVGFDGRGVEEFAPAKIAAIKNS